MISLSNSNNVFVNENFTRTNSKLAFQYRKLKRDGHIEKTYTRDVVLYIQHGKMYKILHVATLFDMFLDFDFGEDSPDKEHGGSLQSSY